MSDTGRVGKKSKEPFKSLWAVKYPKKKYNLEEAQNMELGAMMSALLIARAEKKIGKKLKLTPEIKWFWYGMKAAKQALMTTPLEGLLQHKILYGPQLYAKQLNRAFLEIVEIWRIAYNPDFLKKFERGKRKKWLDLFEKEGTKQSNKYVKIEKKGQKSNA